MQLNPSVCSFRPHPVANVIHVVLSDETSSSLPHTGTHQVPFDDLYIPLPTHVARHFLFVWRSGLQLLTHDRPSVERNVPL